MLLQICGDSHPSATSTYQGGGFYILHWSCLYPFSHLMVVCLPKTFSGRQLVRLARMQLVLTEEIPHTHTHTHTHSGAFETTVCYFASSSVALCYYEIETILGCPEKLGILPPTHTHTFTSKLTHVCAAGTNNKKHPETLLIALSSRSLSEDCILPAEIQRKKERKKERNSIIRR